MNLATWLERAGRTRPELPAIARGDVVVADYGTLGRRAAGIATGLRTRLGLDEGDRVAIVAANHPAYLEALFGIWWAGLAAVPVNSKLHPSEVAWILEHSGARAAFVSPGLAASGAGGEVVELPFESEEYELLASAEPAALAERGPEDLAWLFYTSGTTGRPKGAMLSHRNLAAMSFSYLADTDPVAPGDAWIHAAPMSHGSGLWGIPHVARSGVNVIPESGRFDPEETAALLARWPGASMFTAPTMLRRLAAIPGELDTRGVRTIFWGGAPMPVPDVVAALDRLGPCVAQMYGQGETPMTISRLSKEAVADREHPRWSRRLESAGVPCLGAEVTVADPDGVELPPGEIGEILVRGDTVMAGYWQDPEASAPALRDGRLHTGDVGSFDEHGYLTLRDRSSDLIISGGTNIYPREVEEALAAHPRVTEVSVIGRPDAEWGEVVVAYVAGDASPTELDSLCLERIARFKRPKDYVFVSELPKNNYGKIVKTELRERDRRAGDRAGAPGREAGA